MATTWVLRTETKGTGAQMVPLESVTKRTSDTQPVFIPREPAESPVPEDPKPTPPRRFRIVDVMTRRPIVEEASAREAIDALAGVRSLIDVNVQVWQEDRQRWRLLSLPEQRAMWELARQADSDPAS
ncbi:MAG TPA: hypothetical protein VE983_06185 [Solirubrobacteraceae bacterium]|nr:hypothetical protein [Solirubrobacteraceae bacterium]